MATRSQAAIYAFPEAAPCAPRVDPLDADMIGFDNWLLPTIEPRGAARLVQALSIAAGPVALLAASLALLSRFWG